MLNNEYEQYFEFDLDSVKQTSKTSIWTKTFWNIFDRAIKGFNLDNGNKIGNLIEEEYDLLKSTYSIFVKSFSKWSGWEFLKKTVASIQNELFYLVKAFGLSYEKFLKDIDIDQAIISWTFLNKLKKAEEDFNKSKAKFETIEKEFLINKEKHWQDENFKTKYLIPFNKQKKKYNQLSLKEVIEQELNSKFTNKVTTEVVLKIFIYLWDENNLGIALSKKMDGVLNNTHLSIVLNEKNTYEEVRNTLVFEIMRGLRTYREKLFSDFWHTSKIMSYMDRIARNVCLTSNQKLLNDSTEVFGLVTDNDASSDDSRWDDVSEFSNSYMEESTKLVDELKEETFLNFSSWKYLFKYISSNSTILSNPIIKKYHTIGIEIGKSNILNLILNQSGFYFFEKEQKKFNIYWKLVQSYFDLAFYLFQERNLKAHEISDFLFWTDTIKFAILSLEWDNLWELFFYEIKGSSLKNCLINDKLKINYYEQYKKLIYHLCHELEKNKLHHLTRTSRYESAVIRTVWENYKYLATIEKVFINDIFDELFYDHNVAYISRLIDNHINLSVNKFNDYFTWSKEITHTLKNILNWSRESKENNISIYKLIRDNFSKLNETLESTHVKNLSDDDKFLRVLIRKHFPRIKDTLVSREEYKNREWMPGSKKFKEVFLTARLFLDNDGQQQFNENKDNIIPIFKEYSEQYKDIANENGYYWTEFILERNKVYVNSYKKKLEKSSWYWFKKAFEDSNDYVKIIQNGILMNSQENDDNFLVSSRFYWNIQYIS